ncbi:MAG: formylglycine-generating enzyme family protein, partial [Planctomycetota bacterium]
GQTWTAPAQAFAGAIGSGITPGTDRLIVWDCKADLPGQMGTLAVRVCADDGHSTTPPVMALIPAGEFQMGDTFNEGGSWEQPVHAVYVSAFYMDRYPVTNQQYVDALNWAWNQGNLIAVTDGVVYSAGGGTSYAYCATTTGGGGAWSRITWDGQQFQVLAGKENYPVYLVSFYGSAAYANWRSAMQGKALCYDLSTWSCNFAVNGYRLPTEAEWEKGARGGAAGHRFPWSDTDTIQHARANYSSNANIPYDTSPTRGYHPTFLAEGYPYTSPVGYFAPNGCGLYDMAGNVWERCNDWFSDTYYSSSPYNDPTGPLTGTNIVVRGGSWHASATAARCASRSDGIGPNYRAINIGFRCVLRDPTGGTSGICAASGMFSIDNRNADLDLDGDVDQEDFGLFQACLSGSGVVQTDPNCSNTDFDLDSDVDQTDFNKFIGCMSGANVQPDPNCMN